MSKSDDSPEGKIADFKAHAARVLGYDPLKSFGSGGGGTTYGDMDKRVTHLEEWAKLSDARSIRVEAKLDTLLERVVSLPSRADLLTAIGLVFAVVALVFTGMAWLDGRREPAPPQSASAAPAARQTPPLIINVPPQDVPEQ